MYKKWIVPVATVMILSAGLTACAPAATPRAKNPNVRSNTVRQTGIDNRNQGVTGLDGRTNATAYRTATDIAARVAQIPGIRSASVVIAGRTAYVAINQGTAGATRPPTGGPAGTTAPGTTYRAPAAGTYGGTIGAHPDSNMAGVAGGTPPATNAAEVTDDMKRRVAEVVRQTDPSIDTVYVSANPALVSRFQAFVNDTASGRVGTAAQDLGDVIRRVFPTAH